MFFKFLRQMKVPSDAAYAMALASIVGSLVIWARRSQVDPANAERLGIFIGLWAPTFMIIGNGLMVEEARATPVDRTTEALTGTPYQAAQPVGSS